MSDSYSRESTPTSISDLPSPSTSSSEPDDDDGAHDPSDAEREWRESLQQLELILTMLLVPYAGKYFGRKAAFWGWARYMEWQFPVTAQVTDPVAHTAAGAVAAAAPL